MNCLCYLPDDGPVFDRVGIPEWPPVNPPTFTRHEGYKLIRGYLKRKSNKSDTETKWAIRWMEVEPPDAERADVMLAVYKTDLKEKRLNAVSLRNIASVSLNDDDPHSFVVVVGASVYTLLARDETDARKWVAILNDDVQLARDDKAGPPDADLDQNCLLS
ncbi:hypothetical protein CTAYLR_003431 [Chrysophaeum taylorii]|uniref:PH domain-containing protein n=1 Tax=Chrysophaeum taylorii TaxID=2483200 RepID=A0AAD7XHP9_9STRA|nr:hypothetical protein CTAYLR_003431 [Chrysophaeum taylorii]